MKDATISQETCRNTISEHLYVSNRIAAVVFFIMQKLYDAWNDGRFLYTVFRGIPIGSNRVLDINECSRPWPLEIYQVRTFRMLGKMVSHPDVMLICFLLKKTRLAYIMQLTHLTDITFIAVFI